MQTQILSASSNSHTLLHQHSDGSSTVQQITDVTDAVERARNLHNAGAHQTAMGDKHVASIPIAVLAEWAQKRGKTFSDVMQDDGLLKQFLEDPDNSVFRVWKGDL